MPRRIGSSRRTASRSKFDFISYVINVFLSWLNRFTHLECGQENPVHSLACESRATTPALVKGGPFVYQFASVGTRSLHAGRPEYLGYAGEAGGPRLGGRRTTSGPTKGNVAVGLVLIHRNEIVGAASSQTAESTCPCANKVTVQWWSGWPASTWINSCNAGEADIRSISKIVPTITATTNHLPSCFKRRIVFITPCGFTASNSYVPARCGPVSRALWFDRRSPFCLSCPSSRPFHAPPSRSQFESLPQNSIRSPYTINAEAPIAKSTSP